MARRSLHAVRLSTGEKLEGKYMRAYFLLVVTRTGSSVACCSLHTLHTHTHTPMYLILHPTQVPSMHLGKQQQQQQPSHHHQSFRLGPFGELDEDEDACLAHGDG